MTKEVVKEIDPIKIENISQYIDAIEKINQQIDKENELRPHKEILYRGQANENYALIPKIGRNRRTVASCTIFDQERNLIELAKNKMPDVFFSTYDPLELLAKLQHFGISTRLLDVTENPLVALYFACISNEQEKSKDGEVVVFKAIDEDITVYPVEKAIAETYKFARTTWTSLETFFENIIEQPYFLEQYASMHGKAPLEGAKWIRECCRKPHFIRTSDSAKRQIVQKGRYILFNNRIVCDKDDNGNDTNMNIRFETIIDELPKNHECVMARFIIPSSQKAKILNTLKTLGIDKATLFPDNIDIACSEIDKFYQDR